MNFVYPNFLYAVALIAIPVIIHLFNLVRPKQVVFSSIRFLAEVELKTSRNLKLKHLLVLLSRVLAVLFLVLLFAQPYLQPEEGLDMGSRPVVSIYLDNSYSMSALHNNEELLTTAIKEADQIIRKYPDNTRFQLLDNNFSAASLFLHSKQKALDMLTEVTYSNYTRSAQDIYNQQKSVLRQEDAPKKQLIWFTDGQQSTLGDLDAIEKDTNFTHFLFDLHNSEGVSNAFVDTAYVEMPFIKSGETHHLHVRVRNSGSSALEEVGVSLLLQNQESSRAVVTLPAGGSEMVQLPFIPSGEGEMTASVQLDDNALEFDNQFYLTLEVSTSIPIMSISDSSQSRLRTLYSHEKVFLFSHASVQAVDYDALASQEVIILEGLREIPASLRAELDRLRDQVTIVVIPHKEADMNSYASLLLPFGISVKKIAGYKEDIAPPNGNLPFFQGVFTKIDPKMDMPYFTTDVHVGGYSQLLLKTAGNNPVLVNGGDARQVYIFTGSLRAPASNVSSHSFMIPLMYRLAMSGSHANRYLQSTLDASVKKVNAGDHADGKSLLQLHRDAVDITPDQRWKGKEAWLTIDAQNMEPGFYEVRKGTETIRTMAFNRSLSEGDPTPVAQDKVDRFNDIALTSGSATEVLAGFNYGIPLWKYCLWAALACLLAEVLLIRFFKA